MFFLRYQRVVFYDVIFSILETVVFYDVVLSILETTQKGVLVSTISRISSKWSSTFCPLFRHAIFALSRVYVIQNVLSICLLTRVRVYVIYII